jgi:hypothetical protein
MNTVQVYKILNKHVNYFQGVYPIDLLPSTLKTVNNYYQFGQTLYAQFTLVSCVFLRLWYAEYFDSYGLPPNKHEIIAYLQRHSVSWTFNCTRLQCLTSNVCGPYTCLYALHRARGYQ